MTSHEGPPCGTAKMANTDDPWRVERGSRVEEGQRWPAYKTRDDGGEIGRDVREIWLSSVHASNQVLLRRIQSRMNGYMHQ